MYRDPLTSALFPYTTLFRSWGLFIAAFPWLFGGEWEGGWLNLIRLPLYIAALWLLWRVYRRLPGSTREFAGILAAAMAALGDRKSTRLNSSHSSISYAVFCL